MFHRPKQEEVEKEQPSKAAVVEEQSRPEPESRSAVNESAPQTQPLSQSTKATEEKAMSTQDQENQNRSIDIPSSGSAFPQRPAQQGQAPRMPGSSYASSYSAASSSAGGTAEDRKLVIGRGITLSGEIDSCDVLIVEGTVEAALKGAETLEITESGVFYGSVEIENATIAGRFEGDITATGRLTITATGSITGTISYKEMAMEAGAIIDGRMSPLDAQQSQGSARKDRKLTKASAAKNAGDDSELPLSDTAVAAE